jgi:NAD(P)-dependent dehydrogenase (short-subunit alcohol dehydrogenase family)
MTGSFDGRVALVTGGGSGMGRATSIAFAREGASVLVADVHVGGGQETVATITDAGGAAWFVHADVSDSAAVEAMVRAAVDEFGRLDHAVNNAAIEGESGAIADIGDDEFDRIIAINLRGVFLCMKHEVRQMLAQGSGGTIVNLASTNAFRPQPHQSAYTASKHGVLGLTRAAAMDYAQHGIRINAVCPGAIDTPMLRSAIDRRGRDPKEVAARLSGLGRFGETSEIASAILWLSSEAASFTVGHALAVDGGYLAR